MLELCAKWEVGGAAIGEVTDSARMRVLRDGALVGDMPVSALVDDCPLYDLKPRKPSEPIYPPPLASSGLTLRSTPREILLATLSSPNISSRRPLFERTTRSCSHVPSGVPSRPTPLCSRSREAARWP